MIKVFNRFEKFVGAVLIGVMACAGLASAAVTLPTPTGAELLPYIGASCGGIQVTPTNVGFSVKGYLLGSLALKTTCSTGGKGGGSHTYTGTAPVTWDFAGNVVMGYADTPDPSHVSTDGITAVDAGGDVFTLKSASKYVLAGSLVINEAPPYPANLLVPVPNVFGETQAVATAAVQAQGFQVSVILNNDFAYPKGTVMNENPVAGTGVTPGSYVTIYVVNKNGG